MKLPSYDQVERRFGFNIRRVTHLMALHAIVVKNKEMKSNYHEDLLRSAVVMLHASLEDLLREIIRLKAKIDPSILAEHLRFPHPTDVSKTLDKIKVSDLICFKGQNIDDVILNCINGHLKRRSFNHKEDVIAAIKNIGLSETDFAPFYAQLEEAIERRHKIVHESDRAAHGTSTHGRTQNLDEEEVGKWTKNVNDFGEAILEKVKPPAKRK